MAVTKKQNSIKLYGLVLTGGASRRMKKDKAGLRYQGKTQTQRCMDLLAAQCQRSFVSCRKEQSGAGARQKFEQIHDRRPFLNAGPIGGILSAMEKYPEAAWVVLGCDLPFVTDKTLQHLLKKRNRRKSATVFRSNQDGLPEPLCAVYEKTARKNIKKYFTGGGRCPRKFLILNRKKIVLLKQKDPRWLDNINEPEEYRTALSRMGHHGR